MDFQAFFRILRYKKGKTMGKYLKQGFVRALEWQHAREEISHSKMVELMEEECIKNYLNRNIEVDPDKVIKTEPKTIKQI